MKEKTKIEIAKLISKINSYKENNSSDWEELFFEIKSLYEQAIIYNYLNKEVAEPTEPIVNIEKTVEVSETRNKKSETLIVQPPTINLEPVSEIIVDVVKEKPTGDVNTKLKKENNSLNEKIGKGKSDGTLASKLQKNPITDIYKSISINERFLFTKELFKGNREAFNNTVNRLNEFNNFAEAEKFIKENFDWDFSNNSVEKFMEFVQRRYA